MQEDFSRLQIPDEFVALYPPDRDGLFDLVRSRTTDRMLEFIAEADYKVCVPEHFGALRRIRSGIGLDEPIRSFPAGEVLSLFRWSDFENQDQFQDSYEFHLARAFVCSTLLRVPLWIDPQSIFDPDALAPLIESCQILGEPFLSRLPSLITWGLLNDDSAGAFWAFGLWVTVASGSKTKPDMVRQVGEWVMEINNGIVSSLATDTGAFSQTFLEMDWLLIRPNRWHNLAASLKPSMVPGSYLELFAHLVATPP